MSRSYNNLSVTYFLILAMFVPSCGEDTSKYNEGASNDEPRELNFFWIPKEFNNKVFETGQVGADKRASELTQETGIKVTVTRALPGSATDIQGQADYIYAAIKHDSDGIAISCNLRDGLTSAINDAVAADIPVMTFDADSPESNRFTYLGIDNEKGGALAAQILGESMNDSLKTKVALVSGVEGATNLDLRIIGFQYALAGNFPDLEIVDTVYCNDDGALGATLVEQIMTNHPDIGGLFFVGLWPLFTCDGTNCEGSMPQWNMSARTGAVKTVVFDTLEFQLEFVEAGMVTGLVGQKYWGWGYDAIQMLYDQVVNKTQFSDWTNSGIDLVCPNNYDEMAAMWQNTDFSVPLTPCQINGKIIH